MTYPGTALLRRAARLMALAVALCMAPAARADDYAQVTQLLRSGKLAQALAQADQYLAAKPKDPQMRFLKGVVQSEDGRANDAIETFTRLTEDYPELAEPYNNLAVLHAAGGQLDKARTALEAAVRANPGYAIAHENLGDVYARMATASYGRAQQFDPTSKSLPAKLTLIRQLLPSARGGG